MDDRLELVRLTQTLHLWQRRRGHRSATDDVLCAWAGVQVAAMATDHPVTSALDLGCGQGSVALMIAGALPGVRVSAVEVLEVSYRLLERNIASNGLRDRITPVHADLRSVRLDGAFDLVTGSPPFMRPGSGTLPADPQRAAGRFELRGGVEDYAEAAARWLTRDGAVVLLMDGQQDARARSALRRAGLELRRVYVIRPTHAAVARYRVYVASVTAPAHPAQTRDLAIRRRDGEWTRAFRAIRSALHLPGAD